MMQAVEQPEYKLSSKADSYQVTPLFANEHRTRVANKKAPTSVWVTLRRCVTGLLSMVILGLLLSLVYLMLTRSTYVSRATIKLGEKPVITSENVVIKEPFYPLVYQELNSPRLAEKVIQQLSLEESLNRTRLSDIGEKLSRQLSDFLPRSLHDSITQKKHTTLANQFLSHLQIEQVEGSRLVDISYQSYSPEESADVINTLIEGFIESRSSNESPADKQIKQQLTLDMNRARKKLSQAEQTLAEYVKTTGITVAGTSIEDSEKDYTAHLNTLKQALTNAQNDRVLIEDNYRQMLENGSVNDALLVTTKAQYEEAHKVETRLQNELINDQEKLTYLRSKMTEYTDLSATVETNKKAYEALLSRMGQIALVAKSKFEKNNIHIIEHAVPHYQATSPDIKTVFSFGALGGLLLGLAWMLLRLMFTGRRSAPKNAQRFMGVPTLGVIPEVDKNLRQYLPTAVIDSPHLAVSEAYRVATTNLNIAMKKRGQEGVLVINSVHLNEGKSIAATNFACNYAQMGKKVLLIDCDLRTPSIHSKLGLRNDKGISDYLIEDISVIDITQSVKPVRNLYVIAAGNNRVHPAEVLGQKKMATFLTHAKKHFDIIILDSPPVLGFAEALVLNDLADASVLVSDERRTDKKSLEKVMAQLNAKEQKLLGTLRLSKGVLAHDSIAGFARQEEPMGLPSKKINLHSSRM